MTTAKTWHVPTGPWNANFVAAGPTPSLQPTCLLPYRPSAQLPYDTEVRLLGIALIASQIVLYCMLCCLSRRFKCICNCCRCQRVGEDKKTRRERAAKENEPFKAVDGATRAKRRKKRKKPRDGKQDYDRITWKIDVLELSTEFETDSTE